MCIQLGIGITNTLLRSRKIAVASKIKGRNGLPTEKTHILYATVQTHNTIIVWEMMTSEMLSDNAEDSLSYHWKLTTINLCKNV